MKAEHRKELEQNALAHNLAKSAEALKSHGKMIRLVAGVVLAVVAVTVVSWYFLSGVSVAQSQLWDRLSAANDVAAFEKLAADNRGTVQARTAQFEAARLLVQDGFTDFGTSERHADAVAKLDKARDLYKALIPESTSFPLLHQEALMGVARIEETLCATPRIDASGQMYGTLAKAEEYYKKVATDFADTFQGKKAKERLDVIQNPEKRDELQKFYFELNRRFTKL
jgi:hypothetical protein